MTPIDLDSLAADPLAARLHQLAITTPAAVRAVHLATKVPQPSMSWRRRRRALVGATLATVVVGANGVASYWMPTWAYALAKAPLFGAVAGPVLRDAGLTANDVTVMDDTGNAHGITLHLVGGDSDGVRTTLLIDAPQIPQGPAGASGSLVGAGDLVDQFGHHYAQEQNGDILGQLSSVDFAPLRGPAASLGARFSVTFTIHDNLKPVQQHVLGTITLHGTLLPSSAREIIPPPALDLQGTKYEITEVRVSSTRIEVRSRTSGAKQDAQTRAAMNPQQNAAFLADPANQIAQGQLVGPDGHVVRQISGFGSSGVELPSVMTFDSIFAYSGAGTYRWELVQPTPSGPGTVIGQQALLIP